MSIVTAQDRQSARGRSMLFGTPHPWDERAACTAQEILSGLFGTFVRMHLLPLIC